MFDKFAISFCYSVLWNTLPSFGHPPHPHSVQDPDKLEQWRDVRGMEYLVCEERLSEWGLFSLEQRLVWESQQQPSSTYKKAAKTTEPGSTQAQQNTTVVIYHNRACSNRK